MSSEEQQLLLKVKGARIVRKRQSGSTFELLVPAFYLKRGEMACVVGESGCGKSTLLDFLALVLRPQEIESFFIFPNNSQQINIGELWNKDNDKDISQVRRRYLGYVLQTGGLLPFLTLRENFYLPIRLNKLKGLSKRIEFFSKILGIYRFLDEKPQSLSGGQRQRAAILRALIHKPLVVFADEPTAAVDRKRALDIINQFKKMAREEMASVVMVTHDRHLVKDVADRWFGFKLDYPSKTLICSTCYEISS